MMQCNMKPQIPDLLKTDFLLAIEGHGHEPRSPLEKVCRAVSVEPDARRSELLSEESPELVLPAVRSHLLRGKLDEAGEKLETLTCSSEPGMENEAQYEKAR